MARAKQSGRLPDLGGAEWLKRPETRRVFAALAAEGAEARAVGGAVRNALMGTPVKDIDIATTALPADVMRLSKQAGLHAVPTGFEHGTVTVVADHVPFEVTTLRRDIETFGRHARVTFTTDWREDALRRDFTMNALYCGAEGTVHDPLGGYADLVARRVRFIGDARQRIREDYLRILRFLRFLAEYGDGAPPDPEGLAAAIAEKSGLAGLSGERIRTELLRLLGAPGAVDAARAMRDAELAAPLLGMPVNVERLARLVGIEETLARAPDPVLRLAALVIEQPKDATRLQERLRLSAAETDRLTHVTAGKTAFDPAAGEREAQAFLYRHGAQAFVDGALMDWARSGERLDSEARAGRVRLPERWRAPALPVRGADVIALGVPAGPEVGHVLAEFESWWIANDFPADRKRAADKLGELVRARNSGTRDA
jgi:poly(A) polymerase